MKFYVCLWPGLPEGDPALRAGVYAKSAQEAVNLVVNAYNYPAQSAWVGLYEDWHFDPLPCVNASVGDEEEFS